MFQKLFPKSRTCRRIHLNILTGYKFTQNKKTDELIREAVRILNKKKVVLVFDEIDKADDHHFIYTLSEEVYRKSPFTARMNNGKS